MCVGGGGCGCYYKVKWYILEEGIEFGLMLVVLVFINKNWFYRGDFISKLDGIKLLYFLFI